MAATIVGLTSITFGGSAETVAVFTSFSQTSDSDKTIVVNEDGDMWPLPITAKSLSPT